MLGIVGAMDVEINDLISSVQDKKEERIGNYTFYIGKIKNKEVVILKSGIGKVASSLGVGLMIEKFHPEAIVNTGIAGGVAPLASKDIVLTKTLCYGDVDATVFGYKLGQVPQMPECFKADEVLLDRVMNALEQKNISFKLGNAMTFDSFVSSIKDKKIPELKENTICEMEGAAIAQACYILNTPFLGIRYVSDVVDSESQIKDYLSFETEMAHLSSKIIKDIISLI